MKQGTGSCKIQIFGQNAVKDMNRFTAVLFEVHGSDKLLHFDKHPRVHLLEMCWFEQTQIIQVEMGNK